MCTYTSKKIILLLVMLSFCVSSCGKKEKNDEAWDVLSLVIPEKVSPEVSFANIGFYVLRQTHEPIFHWSNIKAQYYSTILKSWNRSSDFKIFTFCPDATKLFDRNQKFSEKILENSLKKSLNKASGHYIISTEGKCVVLKFERPEKQLLKTLSYYEMAPSISTENPKIELGLGPFKGIKISDDELFLERKEKAKNGYNYIRFTRYKGLQDRNLNNVNIEDFNRIYVTDVPDWIKKSYDNYGVMLLQSLVLLINVKDPVLRSYLYNCLDVKKIRQAFSPRQEKFYDIGNILPVGIIGASNTLPVQKCEKYRANLTHKNSKALIFLNWKESSQDTLSNYFSEFSLKNKIEIKVNPLPITNLLHVVFNRPHAYDLHIMAIDAVRPDYSAFYEFFNDRNDAVVDINVPIKKLLNDLYAESNDSKIEQIVKKINGILANSGVVLPLYQQVRDFYYPKNVKNISFGKNFLEYPDVAELKL